MIKGQYEKTQIEESIDEVEVEALHLIFEMAKKYEESGDLFQAIPLYETIMSSYPETPEADKSKKAILIIAQNYEREGKKHVALSLYSKIANI